jgi:hypothetical protein
VNISEIILTSTILISVFVNFWLFRMIETTVINRTDNILNNQNYFYNFNKGVDIDVNKKTKKKN